MSKRFITVQSKKIPLGIYIAGIKKAKANPNVVFKHGLACWWSCTGKEIMEQFLDSIQDRINQGIPYIKRGI